MAWLEGQNSVPPLTSRAGRGSRGGIGHEWSVTRSITLTVRAPTKPPEPLDEGIWRASRLVSVWRGWGTGATCPALAHASPPWLFQSHVLHDEPGAAREVSSRALRAALGGSAWGEPRWRAGWPEVWVTWDLRRHVKWGGLVGLSLHLQGLCYLQEMGVRWSSAVGHPVGVAESENWCCRRRHVRGARATNFRPCF